MAQWRDDLAVVRGLGLVPVAGEGTVSAVLVQATSLIPIGGRLLRAAWVSVLGLAISSGLIFVAARRLLEAARPGSRLGPPLALSAALMATLSPAWQLDGTIAGGVTVAAALALAGLVLRPPTQTLDARAWLGWGALMAAAAVESHPAGMALAGAVVAQLVVVGKLPGPRHAAAWAVGAATTAALCLSPLALRPLAERAWVDVGLDLTAAVPAAPRGSAVVAWLAELGVVPLALGAAGALLATLRGGTRLWLAPWGVLVAADLLVPAARGTGLLATESLAAVRLLALAGISVAAALGAQTGLLFLAGLRLPFARPAAYLLGACHGTLALVAADDGGFVATRGEQQGAETWTEEALAALPPRALVLVQSEAMAWRLWAARVSRGERPDLVVVPLPLLGRGSVATRLLALEPALGPLVRDVAVRGAPGEHALSSLADLRPVYLELDTSGDAAGPRSWDPRLLHHLVPRGLWLEFRSHPLGNSDRGRALAEARASIQRVAAQTGSGLATDRATRELLTARVADGLRVADAVGDRVAAAGLAEELAAIAPTHPAVAGRALPVGSALPPQARAP